MCAALPFVHRRQRRLPRRHGLPVPRVLLRGLGQVYFFKKSNVHGFP